MSVGQRLAAGRDPLAISASTSASSRGARESHSTPVGDDVIVLDPDPDVLVALHRGAHLGDHRAVLRRIGQDIEQLAADVDAGLDGEHVALGGSCRCRTRGADDRALRARSRGPAHGPCRGTTGCRRPGSSSHWSAQGGSKVASTPSVSPSWATPRATTARAASRQASNRARLDRALRRRGLRVAHDLVDRPLLAPEVAARGQGAGDVGGVAAEAGADVHHHHFALPIRRSLAL